MTTATLNDCSGWTERDSVFWYVQGAIRATRSARRIVGLILVLPPLLMVAALLAQLFPFRISKVIRHLNGALPDERNVERLLLIRDMLVLVRASSSLYGRLCIFHRKMIDAIVEVDETIDSLNLVLTDGDVLRGLIATAEMRRSPDLPLQLRSTG